MKRVYLIGVINEDPKTHEWRRDAWKMLKDQFDVDNPTRTRFDKMAIKEADGDTLKMRAVYAKRQAEILLPKSLRSVELADIVLINLSIYDEGHAGHIMELAWAYQLHKTVIAIRGSNFYSRHPMVLGAVHAWADSLEEAVEIIKEFFTVTR